MKQFIHPADQNELLPVSHLTDDSTPPNQQCRKLKKKFWEGGSAPSPDPCPIGEGTPPPQIPPPRCLRRLDTRAFSPRHMPPRSKILDPPLASSYFLASSSLIR